MLAPSSTPNRLHPPCRLTITCSVSLEKPRKGLREVPYETNSTEQMHLLDLVFLELDVREAIQARKNEFP